MHPGFLLRLREDEPLGNGRGKVYLVKCSKIYLVSGALATGKAEGRPSSSATESFSARKSL